MLEEGVYVVGLFIFLGFYVFLVKDVMDWMCCFGLVDVFVVVGGIILLEDEVVLKVVGVSWVYIFKDF